MLHGVAVGGGETENMFSWSAFDEGALLCNCFASLLHAAATYIRRVLVPWEKLFCALGPKVTLHFSFTLRSHTSSLSLSLFRPFPLIFLTPPFFYFYKKDIFNVGKVVEFLANWLKLAAQEIRPKREAT